MDEAGKAVGEKVEKAGGYLDDAAIIAKTVDNSLVVKGAARICHTYSSGIKIPQRASYKQIILPSFLSSKHLNTIVVRE